MHLQSLSQDPQTYAKPFFRLQSFRNTYADAIPHPHDNLTCDESLALIHDQGLGEDDGTDSEIWPLSHRWTQCQQLSRGYLDTWGDRNA
jgi:hypothetical protein